MTFGHFLKVVSFGDFTLFCGLKQRESDPFLSLNFC